MDLSTAIALKNLLIEETRTQGSKLYLPDHQPCRRFSLPKGAGLALGVTDLEADIYGIAVRVQQDTPGLKELADKVDRRAHGETDHQTVGAVKEAQGTASINGITIRSGLPIGHFKGMDGRLSLIVRLPKDPNHLYGISNNHVLAVLNRAKIGDVIVHPGRNGGGRSPRDRIGHLIDFEILRYWGGLNEIDAGICLLDDLPVQPHVTAVVKEPRLGDVVVKAGDLRQGVITAIGVDSLLVKHMRPSSYRADYYRFDDVFEIQGLDNQSFSAPGDSGSLVCDSETGDPVGIVFGGRPQAKSRRGRGVSYAYPLQKALSRWGAIPA
jgi:hypothetical protein